MTIAMSERTHVVRFELIDVAVQGGKQVSDIAHISS